MKNFRLQFCGPKGWFSRNLQSRAKFLAVRCGANGISLRSDPEELSLSSLTNAHALARSNYDIKDSLVILSSVLIATLDNLLNCSFTGRQVGAYITFSSY